jgi:CRP-like cAMP-binding protein
VRSDDDATEDTAEDTISASLHCGMAAARGTVTAVVSKHTLRLLSAKSPPLMRALHATLRRNRALYERCASGGLLKPLPLMVGLPPDALRQLGALLDISAHPPDMMLLRNVPGRELKDSDTILVVMQGTLRLTLRDPQGLVLTKDVGAGAVVNHEALLPPSLRGRGASLLAVQSLSTVVLASLSAPVANAVIAQHRSSSAARAIEGMGVVLQELSTLAGVASLGLDPSLPPRQVGRPSTRSVFPSLTVVCSAVRLTLAGA